MQSNEYREMKKRGFFTSKELADICSVNRMTVVRMEERGLLYPDFTSKSKVRYYSLNSLLHLKHILLLEKCGLTTDQIKEIRGDTAHNPEIISNLLDDLIMTFTIFDAEKDPFTNEKKGKIRDFDMRDHLCFVKEIPETTEWKEGFRHFHDAIDEAVHTGLNLIGGSPSIVGRLSDSGELILKRVYVPVAENKQAEGLTKVSGTAVLYASWYGDPKSVNEAFKAMHQEALNRNYRPRGDCIVASLDDYYSIEDSNMDDVYLFLILPVC